MKKIFTLFVAVWAIAASYAAPARPGWHTKTQPDGTTIEVQLVGDECVITIGSIATDSYSSSPTKASTE